VLAVSLALSVAAVFLVHWLFLFDGCGNEEYRRTTSPNQRWDAVAFVRDCGATTGFSTQVSIVESTRQLPNDSGNVLTFSDNEGAFADAIEMHWVADDQLLIRYPASIAGTHIGRKSTHWRQITIRYEQYQPLPPIPPSFGLHEHIWRYRQPSTLICAL